MKNINKQKKEILNWLKFLFPVINDNEYIVVFIQNENSQFNLFAKTHEDALNEIFKYRDFSNVYVGIALYKNVNRQADSWVRCSTLLIDVDYHEENAPRILPSVYDVTKEIRRKIKVRIDAITMTGHGYQCLIKTEDTYDLKLWMQTQYDLANALGADLLATLNSQIIRVPNTFNFKYGEKIHTELVYVNEPVYLSQYEKINQMIKAYEDYLFNLEKECSTNQDMVCVQAILNGLNKGFRNRGLFDYSTYLKDFKKFDRYENMNALLNQNRYNNPPLSTNEINRIVKSVYDNDYHLSIKNFCEDMKRFGKCNLNRTCKLKFDLVDDVINELVEIPIDLITLNLTQKKMNGNQFAILLLIYLNPKIPLIDIFKTCNYSEKSIKTYIKGLIDLGLIVEDNGHYICIDRNFRRLRFNVLVLYATLNKKISGTALKCYSSLVVMNEIKDSITISSLSNFSKIDRATVSKSIDVLNDFQYLSVVSKPYGLGETKFIKLSLQQPIIAI